MAVNAAAFGARLALAFLLDVEVAELTELLDEFQIRTRTEMRKTPIATSKNRPAIPLIRLWLIVIS